MDTWRLWWTEFQLWRSEIAATLNLSNYELEPVSWAKTSFIQPQACEAVRMYIVQYMKDSGFHIKQQV
jgi:hypothetical protein